MSDTRGICDANSSIIEISFFRFSSFVNFVDAVRQNLRFESFPPCVSCCLNCGNSRSQFTSKLGRMWPLNGIQRERVHIKRTFASAQWRIYA